MSDDPNVQLTEAEAVEALAYAAATPKQVDPNKPQTLVVPAGATAVVLDLDKFRESPTRKAGTYRPATVEAFSAYVKRHWSDSSTVWVHPTSGVVVAVLDDHHPEGPDWRQHRVELQLAHTPEWTYWASHDGEGMSQERFAEQIEGGLEEIIEPDSAELLEIAQSFHASVGSTFRSSIRLASGEQKLAYDEDVTAKAGASGDLTVPSMFLLGVSPFVAEKPYRIAARLRFRLNAGRLTLSYKLDRPESVLRDALENVAERLAAEFPQTYVGEPPL